MNRKSFLLAIVGLILSSIVLLNVNEIKVVMESLLLSKNMIEDDKELESEIQDFDSVNSEIDSTKTIEIVATGDVLIHQEILDTQYNVDSGEYDFTNNFQYIKRYLDEPNLAIGNLETTLAGIENYGFSGYPSFNSPDSLADAMKGTGYDVVANMNNHALDRDVNGYKRTRETLVSRGFDVIGTRDDINDKRYIIKDIEGVKLGITSYGYTMTTEGYVKGLNGVPISDELLPLMNYFHPDTLDEDLSNMKEQIQLMRQDGAEVIIFYMHWGDEYELEPNETQKYIAQFLADEKVDIIFGTHPHSLQPIDILESTDKSSKTFVIYSMGNFLSSQRTERIGNPYTEDGVIVSVNITKDVTTNEVIVEIPTYIPTWVNWYEKGGQLFYEVVPATINDADYLTEEGKVRVVESFNRTKSIIEMYNENIKVRSQ